jgi:hypothetical protein
MLLFHGTTKTALGNMIESGTIIPQGSQGGIHLIKKDVVIDKSQWEGFIFLTDDWDLAEWYSRGISNHLEKDLGVVILEIEIDEMLLLPDDIECPDASSWQDSLKRSSQVKIRGPLSVSTVKDATIR